MSKVQFSQCHKFGHFRHNCPSILNDRNRNGKLHASATNFEEISKRPKDGNSSNK